MRSIRNRRKAQERWDKLRKYVIFKWGRGSLPPEDGTVMQAACCSGFMNVSHRNEGSSYGGRHHIRKDTISFNTKVSRPDEKKFSPEQVQTRGMACLGNSTSIPEERDSCQEVQGSGDVKYEDEKEKGAIRWNGEAPRQQRLAFAAHDVPLPPSLETKPGSEISALEVQNNLQSLYEYNVMLREELIRAQSMLHSLTSDASASKQQ